MRMVQRYLKNLAPRKTCSDKGVSKTDSKESTSTPVQFMQEAWEVQQAEF